MREFSSTFFFFFFNDTATTEIYTLSLHDALPISKSSYILLRIPSDRSGSRRLTQRNLQSTVTMLDYQNPQQSRLLAAASRAHGTDRKSTRLNSSHQIISYAVFCLKKKKKRVASEH